jgi:hypothetical protein
MADPNAQSRPHDGRSGRRKAGNKGSETIGYGPDGEESGRNIEKATGRRRIFSQQKRMCFACLQRIKPAEIDEKKTPERECKSTRTTGSIRLCIYTRRVHGLVVHGV